MAGCLQDIARNDNEVASIIRARHARELDAVYTALGEIVRGLSDFGAKQGRPKSLLESGRLFLSTRSFNSLHSAVMLLERGYYQQAMSLVRMAKEDQLVARDIENHPSTLDALFIDEGMFKERDLAFAKMAERVSTKTKEAWDDHYGFLSAYGAHPRLKSLRALVTTGPDGKILLRPGGQYDKVWVNAVLYHALRELEQTLATVAQLTTTAGIDWIAGAMPTLEEVDALWRRIDELARAELGEPAKGCD